MKAISFIAIAALTTTTLTMSGALHAATPNYITAAVGDASRPDRDTARDVNRKPADVLTFAGVKPGDQIGELMPGGGYYTRLLCKVAGDKGHVYTMAVTPTVKMDRPPPDMANGMAAGMGAASSEAPRGTPCTNVSADAKTAAEFSLPANLDLVWTTENYHDLNNSMFGKPDMVAFNKAVFAALKPGGVYVVEDHAAQTGSGTRDTETLHRIDPEQVKKDATAAGFVFAGSSDLLKNADDAHTDKVFQMNGKSDKFLFKFRKPK